MLLDCYGVGYYAILFRTQGLSYSFFRRTAAPFPVDSIISPLLDLVDVCFTVREHLYYLIYVDTERRPLIRLGRVLQMQRCVGSVGAEKPAPSGFLPRLAVPFPRRTSAGRESGFESLEDQRGDGDGLDTLRLAEGSNSWMIWLGCQLLVSAHRRKLLWWS
jgi:hypothetical protein